MRPAGAALVDEDDVARAAHAIEGPGRRGVEIDRRRARPARDQEQRIVRLVETDRRHACDEQLDLAAGGLIRILGNQDLSAFGRHGVQAREVLEAAGLECKRGFFGARGE
jgi:hypothetical protein